MVFFFFPKLSFYLKNFIENIFIYYYYMYIFKFSDFNHVFFFMNAAFYSNAHFKDNCHTQTEIKK